MKRAVQRALLGGLATITAAAMVTGCSSTPQSAPQPTETGPVTIEFWTWAAGMDVLVKEFNESQDRITVTLGDMAGADGYQKLTAAVEAGNGPDLAQVEYQQIPTFATGGLLQDVTDISGQYEKNYLDWAWDGAGFLDQHYGIPNDAGPMVMYYNADLYQRAGIEVPTTWDEFTTAAEKLKAYNGASLSSVLTGNGGFLAGLSWQNGAKWFDIDGDAWTVDIDDKPTQKVTSYWADLVSKGLADVDPGFNPGFWAKLDNEQVASYIVGAWGYRGMKGNLKATAGKWAVAPLPQWDAKKPVLGNMGGSTWSVMKGSKHAAAALEFANWLASDPTAMNLQWANSGYYPAAADASSVEALGQADDFFGGQKLGTVLGEAAKQVDTSTWQWGPNMTTVYSQIADQITPLMDPAQTDATLSSIQKSTVEALKNDGLNVK